MTCSEARSVYSRANGSEFFREEKDNSRAESALDIVEMADQFFLNPIK